MKLLFAVRNVAAHAAEMGAQTPADPVFFLKPITSLQEGPRLVLPRDIGQVHYEAELAVEVARPLKNARSEEAAAAIGRLGVVLDLTARELQAERKKAGLPWLEAKGFNGACVLGPLADAGALGAVGDLEVRLVVNDEERQRFRVADYQVQPAPLLARASRWIRLEPGDLLGCGTGAGVGPLFEGDALVAELVGHGDTRLEATVVEGPTR